MIVLGAAVLGGSYLGWNSYRDRVDAVQTGDGVETSTFRDEPTAPVIRNTLKQGVQDLATGEPVNILVLGDSTGSGAGSWVQELSRMLGERTGREVTLHSWNREAEPPQYTVIETMAQGAEPPIVIWNGSAPSEGAEYSRRMMEEQVAVPKNELDLVFVSHGHNNGPSERTSTYGLVLDKAAEYPDTTFVTILQNPERPGTPHAEIQAAGTAFNRARLEAEGFPLIDIEAVFEAIPKFWKLYTDALHTDPEKDGAAIWAQAVMDELVAAMDQVSS